VAEEGELHQINSGLAVGPGGLTEVLDGPDNGEENSAAANNIDEEEDLFPGDPVVAVGATLVNDDLSDVGDDLKGDDNHENLLFLILKEGFEEGPAGADQDNESEERNALEEAEDVEDDVPAVGAAGAFDVGFVLGLAQEIQGLQDDDGEHEVMDAERGQSLLVEHADPESGEGEIDEREKEIDLGKDGSAGGEVVAAVALAVEIVHGGFNVHGDFELLWVAVGEDEVVLIGVGFVVVGVEGVFAVEGIEGVDGLDEIRLKGAANLTIFQLLEDVEPGIEGAEKEADLGEVQIGIGEGDSGDDELKATPVGEAKLVEGNDAAIVVSDLGEADL